MWVVLGTWQHSLPDRFRGPVPRGFVDRAVTPILDSCDGKA